MLRHLASAAAGLALAAAGAIAQEALGRAGRSHRIIGRYIKSLPRELGEQAPPALPA